MAPFVRSPYNYDVMEASDEAGLDCSGDKGRVQQSFEDETNINTIVRRFQLTGKMPENIPQVLQGDFEGVFDFQSAMDLVVRARESFDAMPAALRSRFHNDPQEFVQFTSDEKNFDEAVSFGLIRPEVVAERSRIAQVKLEQEFDAKLQAELDKRSKGA